MSTLERAALTPLLVGIHAAWSISEGLRRVRWRPARQRQRGTGRVDVPAHVAFALVLDSLAAGAFSIATAGSGQSDRKGKGRARDGGTDEQAVVQAVQDVVRWCLARGIPELSLWSEDGLLEAHQSALLSALDTHPPSPPSSGSASAAGSASPPLSLSDVDGETSRRGIRRERDGRTGMARDWQREADADEDEDDGRDRAEVLSVTVWPGLDDLMAEGQDHDTPARPLTLHLLSRCASAELFARIAEDLVDGCEAEDIDQTMIQRRVNERLRFHVDPDLLILQRLRRSGASTPRSVANPATVKQSLHRRIARRLCPAAPPELHAFPFWSLRLTEIYMDPPRPLYISSLVPGLGARGLGRKAEVEELTASQSAEDSAPWDRAVERWRGVEQRLGR